MTLPVPHSAARRRPEPQARGNGVLASRTRERRWPGGFPSAELSRNQHQRDQRGRHKKRRHRQSCGVARDAFATADLGSGASRGVYRREEGMGGGQPELFGRYQRPVDTEQVWHVVWVQPRPIVGDDPAVTLWVDDYFGADIAPLSTSSRNASLRRSPDWHPAFPRLSAG